MTFLGPESDRTVRNAVEAYMDGRLRPEVDGEAVFETRNSRYRLMDGTLFSATDNTLVGAELVGWLTESLDQCLVSAWWQPGARAVLVDRRAGRHIVVTSATRLLKVDNAGGPGSARSRGGSQPVQPIQAQTAYLPATPPTPAPPPVNAPYQVQPPPLPALPPPSAPPQSLRPSSPAEALPAPYPPLPVPPAPPVPLFEAQAQHAPEPSSARDARPAAETSRPPPRPPKPARPVHAPPRPVTRSAPAPAPPRAVPLPAPPPRQGPLPRFETSPSIAIQSPARETSSPEISEFEVLEALPSIVDPPTTPHASAGSRIPNPPSSEDNAPTMRKRVAPRVRPAPPPPGPMASSRGRAAPPPGPASEPFPLRGPNRGLPLR